MAGKPTVFLDTNVLLDRLAGGLPWLFDEDRMNRVIYTVNPVVVQEVLLSGAGDDQHVAELMEHVTILPVDMGLAEDIVARHKDLRHRIGHSNDILIASTAARCDYLLTKDRELAAAVADLPMMVMSPAEFRERIM